MMSRRSLSACQRSRNPRLVCSHMDLRQAVRTAVSDCMKEMLTEEETLRQLRDVIQSRSVRRYNSAISRQHLTKCSDATQTAVGDVKNSDQSKVSHHSHGPTNKSTSQKNLQEEEQVTANNTAVVSVRRHCPAAPSPISMLCDEMMEEEQLIKKEQQPLINGEGSWMQWKSSTPFAVRERDMRRFRHWQNPHKPSPPPTPEGVNKFRSGPRPQSALFHERPRSAQILRLGEKEEGVEFVHSHGPINSMKPCNAFVGHTPLATQPHGHLDLKRRPASADSLGRSKNIVNTSWSSNPQASLEHMKTWIESAAPEDREVLLHVMHTLEKNKTVPTGLEQFSSLKPRGSHHHHLARFHNHWDNSAYHAHSPPAFHAIPALKHLKWSSTGGNNMNFHGNHMKPQWSSARGRPPQHPVPQARPNVLRIKHEQVQTSPRTDEMELRNGSQPLSWRNGQLPSSVVQTCPQRLKNLFC